MLRHLVLIFLQCLIVNGENYIYTNIMPTFDPLKITSSLNARDTTATLIIGNLILRDILSKESFSNNVHEVTGYVKLENIQGILKLPKLAVIHGEQLEPETGAALLIESCTINYLYVPRLQVIKKGKVVIKNSPNLCNWNPIFSNGVNYGYLVRAIPNRDHVDEYNSLIEYENSFTNCKDHLENCAATTNCIYSNSNNNDDNALQKTPTVTTSSQGINSDRLDGKACDSDKKCKAGCRNVDKKEVCNTCHDNTYLNLITGSCVDCKDGHILDDLYCITTIHKDHFLQDDEVVASCSEGFEKSYDSTHKNTIRCKRCDIDLSIKSGKLFSTCKRMCHVIGTLGPEIVRSLYPKYTLSDFDEYIETEEHLLCNDIVGIMRISGKIGLPLSSLWFMSRMQSIQYLDITDYKLGSDENSIFLYFGNLERIENTIGKKRIYSRLADFTLLNKNEAINTTDSIWNLMSRSGDDCNCGKKGVCYIHGRCRSCNNGHQQHIDPHTHVLHTYCSGSLRNNEIHVKSRLADRKFVQKCNEECAMQNKGSACTDTTAFGCIECRNFEIWTHNLARACVPKCPKGYYANGKKCLRCHGGCRNGCTGSAAYRGEGGCNECFSSVSAPKGSGYDSICMMKYHGHVKNPLYPILVETLFVPTTISDTPPETPDGNTNSTS